MAAYDGTIRVNTSIDADGLNRGTKKISDGVGGITKTFRTMGAAVAVAFTAERIISFMRNVMTSFDVMKSSMSGAVERVSTAFDGLKAAIANSVLVALSALAPYIIAVINWFTRLFVIVSAVIAVLFGVKAALGGTKDVATGAAGATGKLADNTKKAEKAARGALAAFDEINVLQQETAAPQETPGAGGGGGTKLPELPEFKIPADVLASITAFKNALLALFAPAIAAFDRLKKALEPLGQTIWAGLKWAWDNILVPLGNWTITGLLPAFLDLLASGVNVLTEVLKSLGPAGQWLLDNFLAPLAAWTGQAILDVLKWLTDRLNDLAKWISENQETLQPILTFLAAFGAVWVTRLGSIAAGAAIFDLASKAVGGLVAAFTFLISPAGLVALAIVAIVAIIALLIIHWDDVKKAAGAAWDWILEKWAPVAAWFQANVVGPIGEKFGGLVQTLIDCGKQIYERFILPLADLFMTYLWPIIQKVVEFIQGLIGELVKFLKGMLDLIVQNFKIAFELVVSIFQNIFIMIADVVGGIITVIGGIVKFLTGVFTGDWKLAWEGIMDIFRGIWEGLGGIVKGVINTIIDLINAMLRAVVGAVNFVVGALNNIKITIPDWVPEWGGKSWGLSIPYATAFQIPRLAKGAVIPPNAQFAAILGDQRSGKNIETPEALMRQIVREEMGNQQGNIVMGFDGTMGELIRAMKPYFKREDTRVGMSLISGG